MSPHSNEAILLLENLDHMTLLCYLLALNTLETHFFISVFCLSLPDYMVYKGRHCIHYCIP